MKLLSCTLCQEDFKDERELEEHAKSELHLFLYIQQYYTVNREFFLKEKKGVTVSLDPEAEPRGHIKEDKGIITMYLKNGLTDSADLFIRNENHGGSVMINQIKVLYPCRYIRVKDKYGVTEGERKIKLKKDARYNITFEALPGGENLVEEMAVVFQLSEDPLNSPEGGKSRPFYILRLLCVQFLDEISEATLPESLFEKVKVKKSMLQPPKTGCFVPGKPPSGFDPLKNRFLHYYPDVLWHLVRVKFEGTRLTSQEEKYENQRIRDLMKEGLNPGNYREWFQTQLWIEEIQSEMSLCNNHQYNVPLYRQSNPDFQDHTECIAINVPGITEKRPHIMVGDSVFVRYAGQEEPVYEGLVHRIGEGEMVYLGFADEFMQDFQDGMRADVQFWFNRTPLIRCHKALLHSRHLMNVLFPCEPETACPEPDSPLEFYDTRVSQNEEQRQAVTAMVFEYSAPAPYVLFGPPGTGKTLTIVEAIKQIYKKNKLSHMLVCGPSNACCDLLTERLLDHIPPDHIIRVHAKSRPVRSMSQLVQSVSPIEDNQIMFPSTEKLATYRIIVTTFMTAAKVIPAMCGDKAKPTNEFTHVFLDEAGHGQECEALVPLLGLGAMVVLAGDPCQLGPVVHSKICFTNGRFFKGFGLDQSLLERLMNIDLYSPNKDGVYNSRFVTKLLDNYRSHTKILHIPNKLFYKSQLRTCGDETMLNSMLTWKKLPNKKVPVLFRGVEGKDAREGNNPSYFNPQEVSRVIFYVESLLSEMKLPMKDIGIVAPYRAQIIKLKDALYKRFKGNAGLLRVGSPEEFQGDERRVIIVSTVRASAELLYNDVIQQLGFLCNPKRFNVAVTRAQALLVVVGCPWLLQRDPHWGALLQYCEEQGCYTGCKYLALSRKDIDEVYKRYEDLKIDVTTGERD